ncbi:hypothetical protein PISMIDRAFT_408095 [Pisolithus microcarpus 441]|uniref:Uncharacterized protein n=1 Tax=Pisolithus microcarpus 441 TaxID=765257 RepID=A0A0C9ZQ43_9AGAM|nr:hypothetical protein PISMIDRAFT_408095 [Pisolithus microcarpus 441]
MREALMTPCAPQVIRQPLGRSTRRGALQNGATGWTSISSSWAAEVGTTTCIPGARRTSPTCLKPDKQNRRAISRVTSPTSFASPQNAYEQFAADL